MAEDFVQVYVTNGQLEAEMIRLFLEAKGIQAVAYGESAGAAYGLTVGPLGEVKIYVRSEQANEATQILNDMESGKYENVQLQEPTPPEDEDTSENKSS